MAEMSRGQQIQQALGVMRQAREAGQLSPEQAEQLSQLEKLALDSGELPGYESVKEHRYTGEPDEPIQESFNPANLLVGGLSPGMFMRALAAEPAARAGGEGQTGSIVMETAGNLAAGALPGGSVVRNIARPLLGALGAGAGLAAEREARGLETTSGQIATEAGLSAVPQIVEESVRGIGRKILRGSRGAGILKKQAAATELGQLPRQVFSPPGKDIVDDAYKRVRESGAQININPIRGWFNQLDERDLRYIARRTEHFGKPDMEGATLDTQREILAAFAPNATIKGLKNTKLPEGAEVSAISIGALDSYRQQVNRMARASSDPHAQDLLTELRVVIDDAIDGALSNPAGLRGAVPRDVAQGTGSTAVVPYNRPREGPIPEARRLDPSQGGVVPRTSSGAGPARRGGNLPPPPRTTPDVGIGGEDTAEAAKLLEQARAAHWVQRSADYFDELVHKPGIISRTEGGHFQRVHLGRLMDAIDYPQNELGREVKRRLDAVSGAGERFNEGIKKIQRHFPYIEMAAPSAEGIRGSAQRQLGNIMLTPLGRRLLEQAVVEGRGKVSQNVVATIANVVRRTASGESGDSPEPSVGALIGQAR